MRTHAAPTPPAAGFIQQQKAQAIVAFIPGPQLLACNALAKRLDIPLVSLSSGAGNICAWNLTSLGLVPNQQTLPAIDELVAEGKKRWYFLGANYSTPKASIETAKEHLTKLGGTVVGTAYEPSGTADFSQDIANIVKARPDVAFLNVIGDDDVALQKQWAADPRTKGITRVDVLLGEGTAKALGAAAEGIWSSSIYFAAIKGNGNDAFKDLAERSGLKGAPDVNAYVSYMQVQALAAAVKQSGADGRDVIKALRHTDIDGPVGALKSMNSFSYQPVYLAQARSDGTFTIRKKSDPIPRSLPARADGRLGNDLKESQVTLLLDVLTAVGILTIVVLGLAIVLGVLDVINLAHTGFMAVGVYASVITHRAGWPFWTGILTGAAAAAVTGLVVEGLVIRRLYDRPLETILATWGISLIVIQALTLGFGHDNQAVGQPMATATSVAGTPYPTYRLLLILLAAALVVALALLKRFTRVGLTIRMVQSNQHLARALGIRVALIRAVTFVVGCALSGFAACRPGPHPGSHPQLRTLPGGHRVPCGAACRMEGCPVS